ncbi:MAG: glycosyltransferase family 2 protein, partial [Desulfurococcaceae archaeon]
SVSVKEVVAEHLRGSTFGGKSALALYLYLRNATALSEVSNSRYKSLHALHVLRAGTSILKMDPSTRVVGKALSSGRRLGRLLKKRGLFIDLYKAPLVEISLKYVPFLFVARRALAKFFREWFAKNVNKLQVEDL